MKNLRLAFAVTTGRVVISLVRGLRLSRGSVLPGFLAQIVCPDIYKRLTQQAKQIIYVTGTNGKTTTSRLLTSVIGNEKTASNVSGANMERGVVTALIQESRFHSLQKENLVLEVDEKALPRLIKQRAPDMLICLNLFRDQLDRYGEMETITDRWHKALRELPLSTQLIFNGDDPALVTLGNQLPHHIDYFGLSEPEKGSRSPLHAVDSIHCPKCKTRLQYHSYYVSHLGDYFCISCSFKREKPLLDSSSWPSISPAALGCRFTWGWF